MKSSALALTVLTFSPLIAVAQVHDSPKTITEKIEWTWGLAGISDPHLLSFRFTCLV
jgi:hypothetical protein